MSDRPTPETDSEHLQFAMGGFTLDFCRKLERERDEAREHLKAIEEYGTEEINAAVELRSKLAVALVERDEAREKNAMLRDLGERLLAAGIGKINADYWKSLRDELDQLKEGKK